MPGSQLWAGEVGAIPLAEGRASQQVFLSRLIHLAASILRGTVDHQVVPVIAPNMPTPAQ